MLKAYPAILDIRYNIRDDKIRKMVKFAVITGYISVLCKLISFLVAFWSGFLYFDYANRSRRTENGTLWWCLILACIMFTSTLLCDILMTLVLICHKLDRYKVKASLEDNDGDDDDKSKGISMFALPVATHFQNRAAMNAKTRKLSHRYQLILLVWLLISLLFVVGHWINYFPSKYRDDKLLEDYLYPYIVVTGLFVTFVYLPVGIVLVTGLN